ncbi:MAG: PQQ-binding-like beta-propeller repeat protein [Candidatus Dormiibacterota bacterium]
MSGSGTGTFGPVPQGRPGHQHLLTLAGLVVAAVLLGGAAAAPSSSGLAPPEVAANAATGWPAHNYDLANSRADLSTEINATNVATLKQKWTFKLSDDGLFGEFASNPVVVDGYVYFENPDSDVFALNEDTGKLVWEHKYNSATPSGGPNGVAIGYGLLFGTTESSAFALSPTTGKQIWIRKLISNSREGIDMAPTVYGGKVLISTIPGNSTSYYTGGAYGIVYALSAKTGSVIWSFSTIQDGSKLWGDPKVNGGGGAWYPAAVDSSGRVFLGTGNPSPVYPTKSDPNAKSRPGPNLYTDSLLALNGNTGKLLWYQQVTPHDIRDYDFEDSPIITTQDIDGTATEVVIGAGKSGKVVAFDANTGSRIWTLNIGKHNQYQYGNFPAKSVTYCPGSLGGVLTPMAETGSTLYVPWIDWCFKGKATGPTGASKSETGGLAAVNAVNGAIEWTHLFRSFDSGGATIANNVVFTSDFFGTIYALSTTNGAVLWSTKAPAGINSFPAVTKDMLIIGAGARTSTKKPHGEIIAYSLGGQ